MAGVIYFRNPFKKTEELLKALSDKGLGTGYLPDVVLSGGCVFRNWRITGQLRKWCGGPVGKNEERLPSNALCPALSSPSRLGCLLLGSCRYPCPQQNGFLTICYPLPPPQPLHEHLTPIPGHVGPLRGARPRPRGSLTSSVHRAVGSASRCQDSPATGCARGLGSWSGGHVPDTGATQSPCLKVVGALGRGIGPSLNRGPALHKLGDLEHVT